MASIASFFKPKPAKRKADGDDTAASATPKKQATGAAASRKEGDQTDPAPAVTADPVATEVCSSARGRSGMPTRPPLRPRSSCAFFFGTHQRHGLLCLRCPCTPPSGAPHPMRWTNGVGNTIGRQNKGLSCRSKIRGGVGGLVAPVSRC